ncbi:hypothetical protein N8754_01885 [Candidatus Pelagibacter sp.]|nr:hypothetical protein [Candidatus Pelagibacter sp.]
MLDDELKNKIVNLFKENQFSKVLELTEKIGIEDRPAGLENIIGISKYNKKDVTLQDLHEAFLCFERAFLKDKNSIHGLNGIMNLIKLGTKACHVVNRFSEFLQKAAKYYLSVEKNYKNNEDFLIAGTVLFSYLLDHDNLKERAKRILNSELKFKFLRGNAIFENNYNNQWTQLDHLNFAIKNSKYFSKLQIKEIDQIDYEFNSKINLGFISPDFERNHSTTFFLKDTIRNLSKDKFKIYLFSIAKKNTEDQMQNELRGLSDVWFDVNDFSNQKISELIQKERINILIDLMGYTRPKRLELFHSRIAPKQVSWLAYCNTTGVDEMDYLIADKNLILDSEEKLYSEKIIKLPHIWNSHSGFGFKRKLNELPYLNQDIFTFGSLNNFRKISDDVVETWSKILHEVSNSKLILKSSTACDYGSLLNKFKKFKVDHKIEILRKLDFIKKEDHLKVYNRIDLCLDTFPYNGVTTTFEALWMNVPVVVMKGYNFNSRCGESIIKNLGTNDLISENKEDYIINAIKLSNDKNALIDLRKNIFEKLMQSSLFNTREFSKNFSETLLKIHNS